MIQFPRLLDSSMTEIARLEPVSLSLNLNMAPLSTATLSLPEGQPEVQTGAFVELFTPHGSAGIFRVQQVYHEVGGVMTLNLEHGLVTLSDGIIPGTSESQQTASVKAVLEMILSQQSTWKLGKLEVPDDVTLAWGYDYSNLLESLLSVLDELPSYMAVFDQTSAPWIIDIVAVSETPASECRLSRNINSLSVETDRSELCTRLYVPGLQAPLDADTIGKWGVVSRSLTGDEGLTAYELTAYGTRYLEEHKNPALTISIDAFDLSKATGEPMDAFRLGYMCRVCLPDYDQTINQRVVSISWPDMVADDENVTLTLASSAETAADTLAGLIVDTTVQRRLIYKNGQELDRLVVRTIANENQISIITPRLEILALDIEGLADRITFNANDILTLSAGVDDNKAAITLANGRIDANANAISLQANNVLTLEAGVAENKAAIALANGDIALLADDITANANAIALKADQASLDLANGRIDAQANEIALKANKIDLQGFVTATELETVRASVANLTSGLTTAQVLRSNWMYSTNGDFTYLSAAAFTHNGALVSQRNITMGSIASVGKALSTGGELDLQHSHEVSVDNSGKLQLGGVTAEGEGGNFNIADTQYYKDGVSAAAAAVGFASFAASGGVITPRLTNDKTTTYFCSSGTADEDHNIPIIIAADQYGNAAKTLMNVDASGVYKSGWNECRATQRRISNVYTISQNAPGTLYMLVSGNYTSVGSDWVKVSAYNSAYTRASEIA